MDFGDNPYTIKTTSPSSPKAEEVSSKWDWNKMFVPLEETMNAPVTETKECETESPFIKYSSPFKNNTF